MADPTQGIALIVAVSALLGLFGLVADRFGVDSREPIADDHRR